MVALATVDTLAATPAIGQITLDATFTDPHAQGLPYLSAEMIEFYSSLTNDRDTALKIGEGFPTFVHSGLAEEVKRYYWAKARNRSGQFGAWFPSGATSGVEAKARGLAGIAFGLANGKIIATVNANILTIAVKTSEGNDPSASDPVYFAFRNSSANDGSYTIRAITAALSLTISQGSTLGATNNVPFRIWLVLFDDAGTLRIGAVVCTTLTRFFPLDESRLLSSTAEGGSGGADSSATVYTGTAVTSKPFRILGYLTWESGLGTVGNWSAAPTVIQMYSPGVKKPGELVQRVVTDTTSVISISAAIPPDNTIPQQSEGTEIVTVPITITSAANVLFHDVLMNCGVTTSAAHFILALFKDATANAIASQAIGSGGGVAVFAQATARHRSLAGSAGSTTFKVRGGTDGTVHVNGHPTGGGGLFGGTVNSFYTVDEFMA